jgi:hypothetical protein
MPGATLGRERAKVGGKGFKNSTRRKGMRVLAAMWLSMSLAAVPLLANDAKDAGKEESPTTAVAEKAKEPAKPENAVIESELQDLRSLVQSQMQELESQRAVLKAQQLKMEALEEKLHGTRSEPVNTPVAEPAAISEATPAFAIGAAPRTIPASTASMPAQEKAEEASPLQLRIGSAYIIPVGFMDFTSVFRSHTGGSGIGTNFASIPIGTSLQPFADHLSEFRLSMQNSRIGFRVDAMVKGAHVIGYMESDYLGNNPGNVAVSSNSNTLRSRLYWVDVQKAKWEVMGGQTWSLITPGRTGISPLPGNLFFTQNIDVNYQLGLVWGRIPELRFVLHPTDKVAFAVALDSPEQYTGGSAGGGTIIYPAAFSSFGGSQLNTGGSTLGTPNLAPDVIAKLAFDPSSKVHVELGGLERQFKVWVPATTTTFRKTGGGGFVNLNVQLFPGFRLLTNNFWSDGGGRYIFGQVPDLIVRNDGSLSPIKTGSTVSGFEFTHKNSFLYAYYGGVYVQKNATFDLNGTPIGYGVTPATITGTTFAATVGANQNRAIQEITLGFNQTLWRDAKYGALNFMGQYSFLRRIPWVIPSNSSTLSEDREAHLHMLFFNLRYTLPGSAPTLK